MISNKYKQKKWTNEELQSLSLDYLSFLPKEEMVLKYKRNWESIRVKANNLGLKRGKPSEYKRKKRLSKKEMKSLYIKGLTLAEIGDIANIGADVVFYHLNTLNFKLRSQSEAQKVYTINETFFDCIDTEEKAYFLGILYADGYNDEKGEVHLTLQEEDMEILEKLRLLIKSNKPLRYIKKSTGKNAYSINIENKHISQRLKELGCIRKKSLKLQFPKWLDDGLYSHFIRGYFDGDGSICRSKHNYQFSLEGNKDFLIELQKIIMKELNFNKTKFYQKHKSRVSSVSLKYCGRKQVLKLKNWIYKNANIFMERKYKKWDSLMVQ